MISRLKVLQGVARRENSGTGLKPETARESTNKRNGGNLRKGEVKEAHLNVIAFSKRPSGKSNAS